MCMFGGMAGGGIPAQAVAAGAAAQPGQGQQAGQAPGTAAQNPFKPGANDSNLNAQAKAPRKVPTVLGRSDNVAGAPQKTALGG